MSELKININTVYNKEGLQKLEQQLLQMKTQLIDLKSKFGSKSEWVKEEQKAIIQLNSDIRDYKQNIVSQERAAAQEVKKLINEERQLERQKAQEEKNLIKEKAAQEKASQQELKRLKAEERQILRQKAQEEKALIRERTIQERAAAQELKRLNAEDRQLAKQKATEEKAAIKERLAQEREAQREATKYKDFKGQSVTLGSTEAVKQQIQHYSKLRDTIARNTPEFAKLSEQIKLLKTQLRTASPFQLLEFGENVTVVMQGLIGIGQRGFQVAHQLAKQGAELQVARQAFDKYSGGVENARRNLELLRIASSGNLDDTRVMHLANRFLALGYNINQVAQIFSMAENAGDEFGVSMEEGIEKILRFTETGKGRGFEKFGVDISNVNKKTIELAGGSKELYEALDLEGQQLLRTKALLDAHGESLDKIITKQKGLDDKLASNESGFSNLSATIGNAGLKVFGSQLDGVSVALDKMQNKTDKAGYSLSDYFQVVGKYTTVAGLISMFKSAADVTSYWDTKLRSITQSLWNAKKQAETISKGYEYPYEFTVEKPPEKQPSYSGSGSYGSKEPETVIEQTTRIIQKEKELAELIKEKDLLSVDYKSNTNVILEVTKEIAELEKEIAKYKAQYSGLKTPAVTSGISEVSPLRKFIDVSKEVNLLAMGQEYEKQGLRIKTTNQILSESFLQLTQAHGQFIGALIKGDQDGFKNFMKSVVTTFISSVQAMIFASSAALLAKGITTFGISMITDAPLLAGAWLALEMAKGAIGALETGGSFGPGTYLVGERGPELATFGASGYMYNARETQNILSQPKVSTSVSSDIYIKTDVDFIKFMKIAVPKYNEYRRMKVGA